MLIFYGSIGLGGESNRYYLNYIITLYIFYLVRRYGDDEFEGINYLGVLIIINFWLKEKNEYLIKVLLALHESFF